MKRFLVIDNDHRMMETLGLACLDRDVAVELAENLCEGVRVLLSAAVSLIAVDARQLRLTAFEHLTLFDRVAPGVPVVVLMEAEASLESRVALELAGFTVITKLAAPDDLLKVLATSMGGA
ncbi:MAG: hypothetical protein HYR86_16595 [Candidatus Rokubacteria bacterium]|nr:hypothetical protein [Candidatus Rokubacteria bacterium]